MVSIKPIFQYNCKNYNLFQNINICSVCLVTRQPLGYNVLQIGDGRAFQHKS